jgi:hypothetical protein
MHHTLFALRIPKAGKGRFIGTFPAMHHHLQSMFSFLIAYEQSRPAINEYRLLFNSTVNFYCCLLKVLVFVCFLLYIVHIWLGRRKRHGVPVIEGQQRSTLKKPRGRTHWFFYLPLHNTVFQKSATTCASNLYAVVCN